jgi:hypothetical protein
MNKIKKKIPPPKKKSIKYSVREDTVPQFFLPTSAALLEGNISSQGEFNIQLQCRKAKEWGQEVMDKTC